MRKFGPDADAVATISEPEFMSLFTAITSSGGEAGRIWCKRPNAKGKTLKENERQNMMEKLVYLNGELCGGRWGASSDTCKKLGYETILVNIDTPA